MRHDGPVYLSVRVPKELKRWGAGDIFNPIWIMEDKRLAAVGRLLDVMDELRAKCPWDREQTFESLRSNTIEEAYELVDAITDGDMENVKEEIGDLLLQVVFYAKMGSEKGLFDLGDVADALCDKLIYRHPHVFGDIHADTPEEVKHNWEQLKLRKQRRKKGVLGGVPRSLPSMVKAYRIGEKAASAGFDWQRREDVWDKVREELGEVDREIAAKDHDRMEAEFGDLFFSMINAARLYGVDPEQALERTNQKFIRRFGSVERAAEASGRRLDELTLDEMEALWQAAKRDEKPQEADEKSEKKR